MAPYSICFDFYRKAYKIDRRNIFSTSIANECIIYYIVGLNGLRSSKQLLRGMTMSVFGI
jgi:hypothetical protein